MKKSTMFNVKVIDCDRIRRNKIVSISAGALPALAIVAITVLTGMKAANTAATEIWKLESPKQVGPYKPEVLGNPAIVMEAAGKALSFNGIDDGLFIPKVPIE